MKLKTAFAGVFWVVLASNLFWLVISWDKSGMSDLDVKLLLIRKSISFATVFLAYIAWRVTPE